MIATDTNGYSLYFRSHNIDYAAITRVVRSSDDDSTIIEFDDASKNLTLDVDDEGHEALVKKVQTEVDKAIKEGSIKPCPENSQASKESSPRRALKVQTE